MKPISNDKRRNIIDAKERGELVENIIKWFGVGSATINRIWRKYKQTGSYEPIPYAGRKSGFTKEIDDKIYKLVSKRPDITQEEIIDELSLYVTQSGMSRHMKKLGLTLKKRLLILQDKKEKM